MADLKEESTVENTEINQVEESAPPRKPIDPNLKGVQLFYEKNRKAVNYAGIALLVVIAALCYFKLYYIPEQENEATNEIFWAENYFEKDSFDIALKGGKMVLAPSGQKQMLGFEQIADQYSMTRSGSLASYYAGICCLRTGKYEQAIEFLNKYDGNDEIVAPIALGAIGDSHMELNHMDEAVKYYLKAADKSHNNFTSPHYLKKAGFVYEQQGNYSQALSMYERIQKEFSKTSEGREIDMDIAKVKTLGNL